MSKKRQPNSEPTDLEAAVLGTLWRNREPCTAYFVRKTFLDSPSPKWSGSAGAIYPLLKRLEDRKWIQSTVNQSTDRKQRDYSTTREGLAVFRKWLIKLDVHNDLGLVHDAMRLKVLFMDALPAKEARRLIQNAIDGIGDQVAQLKADCKPDDLDDRPAIYFAARNALLLTRARLAWLKEMAEHFSE